MMDWKTLSKLSFDSEQSKAQLTETVKRLLGHGGIAVLSTMLQMKSEEAIAAKDLTMLFVYRLAMTQLNDIALATMQDDFEKDKPSG